jgi:ribosome-associated protein
MEGVPNPSKKTPISGISATTKPAIPTRLPHAGNPHAAGYFRNGSASTNSKKTSHHRLGSTSRGDPYPKKPVVPMSLEGPELARRCRELADNKKAVDPVLLDLREVGGPSEFFLIVSGESEPHLKAIAGEVEKGIREESGRKPFRISGNSPSQWMILDYGDVLVHVMHSQKRKFYRLEDLWGDAVRLEV